MDIYESAKALRKHRGVETSRLPLVLTEKNNAIPTRRSATREVGSRYKSPTPAPASLSGTRRCPSPNLTRPTTPTSSKLLHKRPLSAERKRPATPPSPRRASTPVHDSFVDVHLSSRRVAGSHLPEGLWPSTMRSLSVSFQSDTVSVPVSKKEKPVSTASDRTLRANSNVAHKQVETPNVRKPTPERKRSPIKGANASDQSENSKPVDRLHSRLIDQHRWPSRIGGKVSSNSLNRSGVDHADKTIRMLNTSYSETGLPSRRRLTLSDEASNPLSASSIRRFSLPGEASKPLQGSTQRRLSLPGEASKPLQKASSNAASLSMFVESGRVGGKVKSFDDSSQVSRLHKSVSATPLDKTGLAIAGVRSLSLSSTRSCLPSPSKTSMLSSSISRGVSPARSRPSTPPSRGVSPSRIRPTSSPCLSNNPISLLSFITDVTKGKKGAAYIEDAHQLRLLYNRHLQWRFANARAEDVIYIQNAIVERSLYNVWDTTLSIWESIIRKRINLQQLQLELKLKSILNDQMAFLDDWAVCESEHVDALSGAVEDLEANTLRLPVTGGAKVDIEDLKVAICSAVDIMQAMGSAICPLLSRVEGMDNLISDVAVISAKGKAMLDECEALLTSAAAMQMINGELFLSKVCGVAPVSRNSLLSLISKACTLPHLTQTHAQVILNGFQFDLATVTKLTQKLFDLRATRHARSLFFSIPKPDIFLFNVLIRGFSLHASSSISLYTHLRTNTNLNPDNFTYAFSINAASRFSDERYGMLLHAHAIVDGMASNPYVGSALADLYCKFSRVGYARKVFDKMADRDTVLWNTIITGLVRNCCYESSFEVFRDMVADGVSLDYTTVATVLPAVAEMQELGVGMGIQCLALKLGFHFNAYVLTGLISLYSKCGDVDTARLLFRMIRKPDLVSYNAIISGFTGNGETECSVKLFNELLVSGERVSSSTMVGLIPVSSPFGHLHLACCIQGFCLRSGTISNSSVSTALVTVYSRLNEIDLARQLFDESPEKTVAAWNAMISGYTQNGLTETAISLFQEMMTTDFAPNTVTITTTLSACAQLGALSFGKSLHQLIKSKNLETNIYVLTALVDMYAKCGNISEALQLFDSMSEKNTVTWNTMIFGYGLHGYGREALMLFNEMLHLGFHPSSVTFLSVLYACSHAGLVREGDEIFHDMVNKYGIQPLTEHYACMVDILGRAGQLEKALEFIRSMPVEPGPAVWGTLLGACMTHKDTNIASIASERLFELDPGSVGYRVLLSNIYSVERNFPKAASIREGVKKRKLAKTPGCTLIEVNGIPHVFVSGDRSHSHATAIYAKLEKLTSKMREMGYHSETVTALHDVEEEEKELMVNVHSEKLAIAFGLITTEPGTEITIIKNLRVCLDCHTATKYISKITERLIVVRDANRFHHFKDGICSCGDYW
ncbi:unnamed protein product [Lupinus luteus]|uniref:DYW domain-containing protein n=1 Tax=Lupinus luteus TaxID=3873 RepID=A0AAV1XUY2_LUPLU